MIGNPSFREIGSEFHWLGIVHEDTFLRWPEPCLWTATARDSLVSIWRFNPHQKNKVLHVPEYFCWDVIEYWKNSGISISLYPDNPSLQSPDWNRLNPCPGDMVLAVNYFGIREGIFWKKWHTEYPEVLLVEDHSHDPLSHWSLTSRADYAFASIRKTFATPDGAVLWSPRNHALPSIEFTDNWEGSALKLAAMILKREYILGSEKNSELKQVFRQLQIDGENRLTTTQLSSISPWSKALIERGYPMMWRTKRSHNVRYFIDLLKAVSSVETLFDNWIDGEQNPFNPIIVFPSEIVRERVRKGLIEKKIYPVVHWKVSLYSTQESQSLSKRVMTIPLDQRYSEQDVERCATILADLVLQ